MIGDTEVVPGALTVVVSSGKGGVGKTTTAVALASALCERGVDVTVIDGDLAGPNVHLVAQMNGTDMVVSREPLAIQLPAASHGFDVVTPVSITNRQPDARVTMRDLFAVAQFAHPPQVVIIDLPPGWTDQHREVIALLPDIVFAIFAPTATALADHAEHRRKWASAWEEAVQSRKNADRRRKLNLPATPTVVSVETMARFVGIPEGGGDPVTVRRIDALPVEEVAAAAQPLVSVPATADVATAALTAEINRIADVVQAALPA